MSPLDKTVLVVEDNDISMRLYHAVLKALGYTVLQATDGMEGWRLAREHRPDLIMLAERGWSVTVSYPVVMDQFDYYWWRCPVERRTRFWARLMSSVVHGDS